MLFLRKKITFVENKNKRIMENKEQLLRIKIIDIVDSPYQGRLFELTDELPEEEEQAIAELSESIQQNGLMQPIVVRLNKEGKYELIDGHRRVIAYRRLGIGQIKAIVKNYNDKEAQAFSIIGNLQRKNLIAIEQAVAYEKILQSGLFSNKRELSKAIGKDETYIGDLLKMLKMDERIIDDLIKTKSVNDVRMLRMIRRAEPLNEDGYSINQVMLYNKVKENKLSRKQLAELIKTKKYLNKDNQKENNSKQETETVEKRVSYTIKDRSILVKINLAKINGDKKELLKNLIVNKLNEINNLINN